MNVTITPPEPPGRTILLSGVEAVSISGAPAPGFVAIMHRDGTIDQLTPAKDFIHIKVDNDGGEP